MPQVRQPYSSQLADRRQQAADEAYPFDPTGADHASDAEPADQQELIVRRLLPDYHSPPLGLLPTAQRGGNYAAKVNSLTPRPSA